MNSSTQNSHYDLTVNCNIDGKDTTFYFDYVESNTVTLTTQITTHPLASGDIIADHQIIQPTSISFSGEFSLYGNKRNYSIIENNQTKFNTYGIDTTSRLQYIESIFERIQREGIHCNIVKMSVNGDSSLFKSRKNMILNSITWTENQFNVGFNFSFIEALTSDILDDTYNVDTSDEDLPILTTPDTSSAVNELLDKNSVIEQTIIELNNIDLIEQTFLQLTDWSKWALGSTTVSIAVGTGIALIALPVIASFCGGLAAMVPVGTIAVAVVGAAAALVTGTILLVNKIKKDAKYIKKFKYYKNEAKREKEENRFAKFISEVFTGLETLEDNLQLLTMNEDGQQQFLVTIDNQMYAFTFTKDTNNSNYKLSVVTIDNNGNTITTKEVSNISSNSITSLLSCNQNNMLFNTSEQSQVYLAYIGDSDNDEDKKDLRNYGVLITSIDMNNFNNMLSDILKKFLLKKD